MELRNLHTSLLICSCLIGQTLCLIELTTYSPTFDTTDQWTPMPQVAKDEFNSTESSQPGFHILDETGTKHLSSLKRILLQSKYKNCCPAWVNLTSNTEIQDELRQKQGKNKLTLKPKDLLSELKRTFVNITYLAIDGQPGRDERDKYYNFFDGVQYYLRLLKVAHNYINQSNSALVDQDTEFQRVFQRQLKSIEFKASQDPTLSSFIVELLPDFDRGDINPEFDLYEDFIGRTHFGRFYAQNISDIRESVAKFDQLCSHLSSTDFPNNFTRPSKQYEMIRQMSFELYAIRNDLNRQISKRVLANRQDIRRIFAKLDDLAAERPYIRMLGDEFSSNPPNFSDHVKKLTHLLDLYLTNNLTQLTFYDELSELPEMFIVLGSSIAHDYETKEIPQYSKYDTNNVNWQNSAFNTSIKSNNTITKTVDTRQSNLSLFGRLFN